MISDAYQKKQDQVVDKLILRFIPFWFRPNYFTFIRIFLVPPIYFLLDHNDLKSAFFIFVFAALTDLIDGALARTRDQITDLGKVLDPIADKMLILTILAYIGFDYFIVRLFVVIILFETVANLASALFAKYLGRPVGANSFGKIKMVLQCVCVVAFLIGVIFNLDWLVVFSQYTLYLALCFAVMAGIEVLRAKFEQHKLNKLAISNK